MLGNGEELEIEQLFPTSGNIRREERNFIITMLNNSMGFENPNRLNIVMCSIRKTSDNYLINGASSSEDGENRTFYGTIEINQDKKIIIKTEITRLCVDGSNDFPKIYSALDIFVPIKDNKYIKTTKYSFNSKQFEKEITIDNYEIIYSNLRKFKTK